MVKVNAKFTAIGYSSARSAQPHIKCAFTAVPDMRGVEPDHKQAKFRQRQPHWDLSP
jgi:hypothetical protein